MSASNGFIMELFKFTLKCAIIYLLILYSPFLLDIEPKSYNISLPNSFDGPLIANNKLSQAEHLFVNEIVGPESLAVWNGDIYTGTAHGDIIRIRDNKYHLITKLSSDLQCENHWSMEKCGRPLGIRFNSIGLLHVIDAYNGLLTVNITTGQVTKLLSTEELTDGKPLKFLDDVVIDDSEDVVYMTDASQKWHLKWVFYTSAEHDESGKIVKYNIRTGKAETILSNLGFPNGIELTDDRQAILICEFNKRRILKHYIKGELQGTTEVFAENLPGEPDNIRRSSSKEETYWIGIAIARNAQKPSFFYDDLAQYPKTKIVLLRLLYHFGTSIEWIGAIFNSDLIKELAFYIRTGNIIIDSMANYGLAIELNQSGQIIQSLHSPDGKTVLLSEVREVIQEGKKVVYLGSYLNNYLGRLTLG